MAVNLIDSNDIEVSQTGSDIQLNVSNNIKNEINELKSIQLYDNPSGTQSSPIILNDNIGNYEYIEIYYRSSWVYGSQKIYTNKSNNGKTFPINIIYGSGTADITFMVNVLTIANNTITITDSGNRAMNGYISNGNVVSLSKSNQIYVLRVVGYK